MPIDDPNCQFYTDSNGTSVISYTGLLSKWDKPESPCTGINLLSVNLFFCVLAICIQLGTATFVYLILLRHRKTKHNILIFMAPAALIPGSILDTISASTYFQFFGYPDGTQLPKIFFFTACTLLACVEGIRLDFLIMIIGQGKVKKEWGKWFMWFTMGVGTILGVLTIALFISSAKGESASASWSWPYTLWFMYVGALDISISIAILHLAYRQTALLAAFANGKLNIAQVGALAGRFKRLAFLQLVMILCTALLFNVRVGYSFGLFATVGVSSQMSTVVYSVHLLQKIQHLKNANMKGEEDSSSARKSHGTDRTGSHATERTTVP
ncbi:uncharacterized protein SPPG_05001 [Spizellomyces punctatus DAOM BR117]|uniref:Uncharacterized protein n=1 Tax=Spizellomyces punctatus (strain DAOM BR117) TaxID=645134 RepID=A0A0L0HFD8_SPIPD|nr:uncharacterized protein SPPG_05001 [Spizellomyces punctatus DAOM BR117]KNC99614.1 hypothetical protein SPPG_05001 [Spizellomyces punctatus DAOM BR117]|eukprot:XP_016607654.1 hypothetical protein SPPG_05001 [Spizellomyces punctatus DAOM BR117]